MRLSIKASFIFLLVIALILMYLGSIIIAWRNIQFDDIKLLSAASFFLFFVICFIGLRNEKNYFLFLPFILIAFPAPVNDLIPGRAMGLLTEKGLSVFPMFTHIDVYFSIGILRSLIVNKRFLLGYNRFIIVILSLLSLSYFVNVFYIQNNNELLNLLGGSYQIRYILLGYLVLTNSYFERYEKDILLGFIIAVCFLFFEALVNTIVSGGDRLSSGSLGMNTFGNAIGAIMIFLLYARESQKNTSKTYLILINLVIVLCVLIILGTKNRISLIATLATVFILKAYVFGNFRKFLKSTILLIVILITGGSLLLNYLPDRFNPVYLLDKVDFQGFSLNPEDVLEIESSWETNSFITRIQLFTTSYNMIVDRPIIGIGHGLWNLKKYEYGFNQEVLIDSHNGYLAILSQYGFLGSPLIYFIYFLPVILLRKAYVSGKGMSFFAYLCIINVFFVFADLANAGISKHQVFAMLSFNVMSYLVLMQKQKFLIKQN